VTTSDVRSADGTVVRAWSNDGSGVPVLLSNGLGSVPAAWPGLAASGSGYRVLTWYHRGTHGTPRPADLRRTTVADHVDDLLAVLDAAGVERAVVAGWSIGVNVAFEAALRAPDRVAALLAVAGVPGGSFSSIGGPLGVPRALRAPLATVAARGTGLAGPALSVLTPWLPVDRRLARLLKATGLVGATARPEHLVPLLREFLDQDFGWYMRLAVAASRHAVMDTGFLTCPVTFVAGRQDLLTSVHDVTDAAARVPHAEVVVLPGSHFLPVEQPEAVRTALDALIARTDLAAPRPRA
jgi:3-oxoadipate enol-lactonase